MEIMVDKKSTRGYRKKEKGDPQRSTEGTKLILHKGTKPYTPEGKKVGKRIELKADGGIAGFKKGGGVGIQTHGNKLAKALNTQRPDQSLFQNRDGYLTGGIKIRS